MGEAREYYCKVCGEKLIYYRSASNEYSDKTGDLLKSTYYLKCPWYIELLFSHWPFTSDPSVFEAHDKIEVAIGALDSMPGYREWEEAEKKELDRRAAEATQLADAAARRHINIEKLIVAVVSLVIGIALGLVF